jgi:CRP/FNR family cyclic AMP-dependent transcriptional regulator
LYRTGNLERTVWPGQSLQAAILEAVPSEVSRGLFAHGRSISLEAEQTLFLAGDEGDGCYRVEDGLLKASVGAPNGGERILAILGPGSVVGELSMIDGAPRSASVTALRDSTLCFVNQADLKIGTASVYRVAAQRVDAR